MVKEFTANRRLLTALAFGLGGYTYLPAMHTCYHITGNYFMGGDRDC